MFSNSLRRFATEASKAASRTSDVVIVGAGPAGLTLATALKANPVTCHLDVNVIEGASLAPVKLFQASPPVEYTNRISSITPVSVKYLETIGAWQHIVEDRIKPFDNIIAYDGVTNAKIDFDGFELGTMCENVNLQASLLTRLQELGLADKIHDSTKVTDISNNHANKPVVTLSDGTSITTDLLVGADGFNSPVRKFAGIESRGWPYGAWGVVAVLKLKYEDFRSIAWQRFLPTGPLALLPLPGDNATMVWSCPAELAPVLVKLPAKYFVALVNAAFVVLPVDLAYYYGLAKDGKLEDMYDDIQWRLAKTLEKSNVEDFPIEVEAVIDNTRARFPMKMSHADSYVAERVALVGDAGHTTHPLAGQGLNMGQGDVKALVAALELGVQRGLDVGSSLALEPYWSNRWPENHVLLGVVDKLYKLYGTDWEPVVGIRSFGLNLVNSIPMLKDFMIGRVSGK